MLNLAISMGVVLASPVIFYNLWAFLSPALMPREKRAIVPALYLGVFLFIAGASLAYFAALPFTIKFMLSIQSASLQPQITADRYFNLVTKLLLGFGAIFELPVVVMILTAMGLASSRFLASKRRYAVAGMAILACVITPGDAITASIILMGPLLLLYELSILAGKAGGTRQTARECAGGGGRRVTGGHGMNRGVAGRLVPAAVALMLAGALPAAAQKPDSTKSRIDIIRDRLRSLKPLVPQDTGSAAQDTTQAAQDSARADSLRRAQAAQAGGRPAAAGSTPLVHDSMMTHLLLLPGYTVTEYRADSASFDADSSLLMLSRKAEVVNLGQRISADSTIVFDQKTSIACAHGKPLVSGQGTESPDQCRFALL